MKASVSNIDLFRVWRDDEDLDLAWILNRILHPEQTEAMKAGEAFHKALELACESDNNAVSAGQYRFQFDADCAIELPTCRELFVSKQYGDLQVRGRVDALSGKIVTDYKTTASFDPDRLMSGYQWRYYLDMMECDVFRWEVFVLRETEDPNEYVISDHHRLEQRRYPELHADCERLANDYLLFAKEHLVKQAELFRRETKPTLEALLEQSIAKVQLEKSLQH